MGKGKGGGGAAAPPPTPAMPNMGGMENMLMGFENMMMGAMNSMAQAQMHMQESMMAQQQQMQESMMSMQQMPQMPEIERDPVVDWKEKQDQLNKKASADYHLDQLRRKGRQDTILTSPLDDEEDANVTGSVLAEG